MRPLSFRKEPPSNRPVLSETERFQFPTRTPDSEFLPPLLGVPRRRSLQHLRRRRRLVRFSWPWPHPAARLSSLPHRHPEYRRAFGLPVRPPFSRSSAGRLRRALSPRTRGEIPARSCRLPFSVGTTLLHHFLLPRLPNRFRVRQSFPGRIRRTSPGSPLMPRFYPATSDIGGMCRSPMLSRSAL